MHLTLEPKHPVVLICDNGQSWEYPSLHALIAALGLPWIQSYVGAHFRTVACVDTWGNVMHHVCHYILRSDFGDTLTAVDCAAINRDPEENLSWRFRRPAFRTWNGEGPVPYTGRRGRGRYYRRMGTVAEHRAAAAAASQLREGDEPPFRAARNSRNLPSAWSDLHRSAQKDRSWKRFRTTRWKEARGCRR
jgi:hypothetical protein